LVKAQLVGKTHWQDSADLSMMFRGTYTSEFYRAIRNLIHDQVALQTLDEVCPRARIPPRSAAGASLARPVEPRKHAPLAAQRHRGCASGMSAAASQRDSCDTRP